MILECTLCLEKIEMKHIVMHMKFVHNSRKIMNVYRCTQNLCNRSFDNQRSFRRHILTHSSTSKCTVQSHSTIHDDIDNNDGTHHLDKISAVDDDQVISKDPVVPNLPSENLLIKSALGITSKFYADPNMSRIQTHRIVNAVREFMNNPYINGLKDLILDSVTLGERKDVISAAFESIQRVFLDIGTEHKRLRQYRLCGIYIESKQILLGYTETKNKSGVLENTKIFSQYIPLSKTLGAFLELPNSFEIIHKYYHDLMKSDSGVISNIVQTEFWKEKTLQRSGITLPLILYQDDFETGNPLGSHSGIHKISALYATLPCMPPEFASQVNKVFLVQLCHSDDVKLFGNTIIYKEVIKELNLLSSKGIEIHLKNKTFRVYFQLILITGDNLGLNTMLGFVESFSATYFCRLCRVAKNISKSLCTENVSLLRTEDNYASDVAKDDVSLTGIKYQCIWNSVINYHCVNNQSVDIMHDEFEGVCSYEVPCILREFILVKKYFTLEELNFRIKYFKFPSQANIPPLFSLDDLKATRLKMSASESKSLVMHLGSIIGDLIPHKNNPHWELFKLLRQIVSITLQTSITSDCIDLLSTLIEEHHSLYLQLFGNTLKPKHHIMLHYPSIMKKIGPLRHIWSMRCESKHQILKRIAKVSASRRNICRSMAIKSQLQFGDMLLQGNPFAVSIKCNILKNHLPISSNITKYLPAHISIYTQLKSAISGSYKYKPGVFLEIDFDEFPIFGKIEHVFCKSKNLAKPSRYDLAFIVIIFHVLRQNDHMQSYLVEDTQTYKFLELNSATVLKERLMVTGSTGELFVPYD